MKETTGNRKTGKVKKACRRLAAFLTAAALMSALLLQAPSSVQAAEPSCKALCQTVLKATGGGSRLKNQSSSAADFAAFSVSERKKISSIMYVCDDKEVYSICVAKAARSSDAAVLLKSLKTYKANNTGSVYLSDYSSAEQKVFKNALCGRKGKYVWYIAMSGSSSVNKKGQTQLKKKI